MKKSKKLGILTLVSGGFSILSMVTNWLPFLMVWWVNGSMGETGNASAIGIIGGADGPTAIFVTSSNPTAWLWVKLLIPAVFLALTAILGVMWRKCQKAGE